MSKTIPFEAMVDEWRQDPKYVKAYESLEEEFAIVRELINARARAHLTQAEVAQRMGTTQSVVARLESGTNSITLKTLERYAEATGSHLRIQLTP